MKNRVQRPGSFFVSKEMVAMLMKPCPRCRRMIAYGLSYCSICRPIAEAERAAAKEHRTEQLRKRYNRAYNQRRDPKYAAFYRCKEWRTMSRAKLQACGYRCEAKLEGCKGLACEVHHKIPIKTEDGWDQRFEWDGLMGVCVACHNILDNKNFKPRQQPGVIDLKNIKI